MTDAPAVGSRVRTVFLGSGGFGVATLRVLLDHPAVELVGVVTAPPRPVGRRQIVTPTPIGLAAQERPVATILTPPRLRASDAIDAVMALRPGLAVLTDYGQIVPAAILDLEHGALNLHPSLLPRFRGATPIPATILAGDAETGVTLMQMDAGLDTGPVVAVRRTALASDERAPALEARLAAIAADLLAATLGSWVRGELPTAPQAADGVVLTRPLRREDGRLDPGRPAGDLERQVRAYEPWPGTFVDTLDGRLAILEASVAAADGSTPGTLTPAGLATAHGLLQLRRVLPAGGTPMAWDAYLRGHPTIVGSAVVPARDALR